MVEGVWWDGVGVGVGEAVGGGGGKGGGGWEIKRQTWLMKKESKSSL